MQCIKFLELAFGVVGESRAGKNDSRKKEEANCISDLHSCLAFQSHMGDGFSHPDGISYATTEFCVNADEAWLSALRMGVAIRVSVSGRRGEHGRSDRQEAGRMDVRDCTGLIA